MSRYRKGRRRAALLGITAGCVGAAVFLGVSVKLYRERKDAEAMIESRHAAWERIRQGSLLIHRKPVRIRKKCFPRLPFPGMERSTGAIPI